MTRQEELIEYYKGAHLVDTYSVPAMRPSELHRIHGLVVGTKSKTVLDYGCGTFGQYTKYHYNDQFRILIENMYGYDPAVPRYNKMPDIPIDGVICTDVLEHIPEDDLDFPLRTIFWTAQKFVFIHVSCQKATLILPNGENAHCTIKSPSWWKRKILPYNTKDLPFILTYGTRIDGGVDYTE